MDINISDIIETEWTREPLSVTEFIHQYRLPQIVKIHDGENKKFQMPANFNLEQPILLYKVYTCRKIHGRSLAMDDKGRVKPSGPALIIPESYPGWLAMVSKDGKTAGHFSSVGEVSRAIVTMFLVIDSLVGLKATPSGMCRVVISSGQVLKALGPYEDLNRQSALLANNGNIHPDFMMYLKCLTQGGETVYLPYSTRGRFYCIASAKSYSINHVFLLPNLLRVVRLPILIRIVFGAKPQLALPYTNIVQLEEVHREVIILGCTIVNNEPILLEINANSAFSFVKAVDERVLFRSSTYRRMCQLCTVEGDRWRQQIRIAHHVIPRIPKPEKLKALKDRSRPPSACPSAYSHTDKMSVRSEVIQSQNTKCKEVKSFFPAVELLDFLRQSYRGHIFPKKFWMFRRARKFEITDKWDESIGPGFDILKTYYSKYKGKKCLTLKIRATKDLLMIKGPEKFDTLKSKKSRTNSDDGYVTSCVDDESIYHSIC